MSAASPLKVVLVGGSGFLASGLRQHLVARGDDVTVIGRGPDASTVDPPPPTSMS